MSSLPEGYSLHVVEETETTMKDVQALLAQIGHPNRRHGFVLQALRQTNGIGTAGRVWKSPEGNLLFSMIVDMKSLHHREVGLVAAVALLRMLRQFDLPEATFKMPNDLLIKGEKFCGILAAQEWTQDNFCNLGVGINVNEAPPLPVGTPYETTCLAKHGWDRAYDSTLLLHAFLIHFQAVYETALRDRNELWRALGVDCQENRLTLRIADGSETPEGAYGRYAGFQTKDGEDRLVLFTRHEVISYPVRGIELKRCDGGWTGAYQVTPVAKP